MMQVGILLQMDIPNSHFCKTMSQIFKNFDLDAYSRVYMAAMDSITFLIVYQYF